MSHPVSLPEFLFSIIDVFLRSLVCSYHQIQLYKNVLFNLKGNKEGVTDQGQRVKRKFIEQWT
jgi:hypothetical protein